MHSLERNKDGEEKVFPWGMVTISTMVTPSFPPFGIWDAYAHAPYMFLKHLGLGLEPWGQPCGIWLP